MEIEGKIVFYLGELGGTSSRGNAWKKREYVLETFGPYPKKVKFTVFGENRIAMMNLEIGKNYAVTFELDSREYNGRWYTDVNALSAREIGDVMPMEAPQPNYQPQTMGAPVAQPAQSPFGNTPFGEAPVAPVSDPLGGGDSDDLPF